MVPRSAVSALGRFEAASALGLALRALADNPPSIPLMQSRRVILALAQSPRGCVSMESYSFPRITALGRNDIMRHEGRGGRVLSLRCAGDGHTRGRRMAPPVDLSEYEPYDSLENTRVVCPVDRLEPVLVELSSGRVGDEVRGCPC